MEVKSVDQKNCRQEKIRTSPLLDRLFFWSLLLVSGYLRSGSVLLTGQRVKEKFAAVY